MSVENEEKYSMIYLLEMSKAKAKKTKMAVDLNAPPPPSLLALFWNVLGIIVGLAMAYHHKWYQYIQAHYYINIYN